MNIRKATIADYEFIYKIAIITWEATYGSILTADQFTYMINLMYSEHAIKEQMTTKGHQFYVVEDEAGTPFGFCSYEINNEPGKTKIHKLYVLPQTHGKGVGRAFVNLVEDAAKENDNNSIILNVNRFNPAYDFYLKVGFLNKGEDNVDIGNGYLMEDYLMEKPL
nr:GNAT family N-acetyltransferase [uncultured Flavobacterium sp.]